LLSKGRKEQEDLQKQNDKSLNEKIVHYVDIGAALIRARSENLDPFKVLETVMPWNKLVESVEEAKKLARPVSYDYIDLLESRYNQLRRYTPIIDRLEKDTPPEAIQLSQRLYKMMPRIKLPDLLLEVSKRTGYVS
jgi:hypothetical protein